MILAALESGFIEGDGPYFPQPRTTIRPAPARSFVDRTYCVAMSPDSVVAAADLGARMVIVQPATVGRPGRVRSPPTATGSSSVHGREPGPPVVCDFVYCDADAGRAEEMAHRHIAGYLASVMEHYELESDHFKEAKGYESYGNAVDLLRAIGLEKLCDMYLGRQRVGDARPDRRPPPRAPGRDRRPRPDVLLPVRRACRSTDAEASMRLFAAEVLPALAPRQPGTRTGRGRARRGSGRRPPRRRACGTPRGTRTSPATGRAA